MDARWIKRLAGALLLVFAAEAVFAAPDKGPRSLEKLEAGRAVHVTMKTHEGFDAIWIGRDGDRAVFERLYPDETIAVRLDALLKVKALPRPGTYASAWGLAGFAAGFFGPLMIQFISLVGLRR
jgi:hypothetical protein